jgi:hypothetical protein
VLYRQPLSGPVIVDMAVADEIGAPDPSRDSCCSFRAMFYPRVSNSSARESRKRCLGSSF